MSAGQFSVTDSSLATPSTRLDEILVRCRNGCDEAPFDLAQLVHADFYEIARRLCHGHSFANSLHASHLLILYTRRTC